MKLKFYILFFLNVFGLFFAKVIAQPCNLLTGTCESFEARCASTGAIKVTATGGTGMYKYKAVGPVTTNFTTSDLITGLQAGTYTVIINDISSNCEKSIPNVVVTGNYQDARFDLSKIDVSCDNGSNGTITVINQQYGRAPYTYSIIAPSPMGVGTTNSTGVFTSLIAGDYGIRMTDSCGGVQTRRIMVNNYTWWIDSYSFTKQNCSTASGFIKVIDSKGNISTTTGIPGFSYGIVRNPGDTIWSLSPNFSFTISNQKTFDVIAKDACGIIKKAVTSLSFTPSVGTTVTLSAITCNSFTAGLTAVSNFFSADYCLYNSANVLLSCNTTGVFNNLAFGSYCIKAHDGCTDTLITRCFTQAPPPLSVNNTVSIINKTCTSFTASITGQVGLTNPTYCIYSNANVLLSCNTTGIFSNLNYGSYCIKTTDGCRDTTINTCFTAHRPKPALSSAVTPLYTTCSNFGISIGGDSLTNPQYCLYNASGVQIICNTNGVFDSLPYGNYCVNMFDPCYDTTIIRCFTTIAPLVNNDIALSYAKACSSFTLTASSANLLNPQYCLYTSTNTLVLCNTTGIFNNVPYGSYCLKSRNSCPDTLMTNCFTVSPNIPSVNTSVSYSNPGCSTFTVKINGQTNLTNPNFCLYDNNQVQLSCNSTGTFNNVAYGSYCIKIFNTCYDTIITRCFTKTPTPFDMQASAYKSCTYGFAYFDLKFVGGTLPVNVKIIRPNGNVLMNRTYTSSSVSQDSIPGTTTGQTYKLIATDACGNKDSLNIEAQASYFTHLPVVVNKCPSASSTNGSGDIKVTAASNMGSMQVRIIKRNGVSYSPSLTPNSSVGTLYTFNDLSPATYIIRCRENNCNINIYDTITISEYKFPNLNKSSAYQCDVNGFSIGAVASGGVAPFTYEIIGSVPATPSIISAPQASPIFNINNGTNYSLVRLRAIDACGNGTLNDGSILPLANTYIHASLNCFAGPTTLSVDTIYNSTYSWYKKVNMTANDSVLVGTGASYFIPDLSPLDTGIYVCKVLVNGGCITKIDYINIDGDCTKILPTVLKSFNGKDNAANIQLDWTTTQEVDLDYFVIEKQIQNQFVTIGKQNSAKNSSTEKSYSFTDWKSMDGSNIYRLKLVQQNGSSLYSAIINVKHLSNKSFEIYPNPVDQVIHLSFRQQGSKNLVVQLYNENGQQVFTGNYSNITNQLEIRKPAAISSGMYYLRITNTSNQVVTTEKVLFK